MKVTFLPANLTVEARRGRTLLDLSKEHHAGVHYECDSNCTCGTCHLRVVAGMENLSPARDGEKFHLSRQNLSPESRLACQSQVFGDVTVELPERR